MLKYSYFFINKLCRSGNNWRQWMMESFSLKLNVANVIVSTFRQYQTVILDRYIKSYNNNIIIIIIILLLLLMLHALLVSLYVLCDLNSSFGLITSVFNWSLLRWGWLSPNNSFHDQAKESFGSRSDVVAVFKIKPKQLYAVFSCRAHVLTVIFYVANSRRYTAVLSHFIVLEVEGTINALISTASCTCMHLS